MSTLSDLNLAIRASEHLKDPRMKAAVGYAKALARTVDMHLNADADLGTVIKLSATLLPQYNLALQALGLGAKDLLSREKMLAEVSRINSSIKKIDQEVVRLQKINTGMVPGTEDASTDPADTDETAKKESGDELSAMRKRRGTA